jgi:hypothetical protein
MISREELITSMKKEGFTVTPRMLRLWANAGLISRPEEVRQQGRGVGATAIYCPETEPRVLSICKSLRHKKDIAQARWGLWTDGFEVDVFPVLRKNLKILQDFRNKATPEATEAINKLASQQHLPPLLSKAHKRIGTKKFPGFLHLLYDMHFQETVITDANDRDIFDKGLSYFFAGVEGMIDIDIYTIIYQLQPYVDPDNLAEVLQDATDSDLRSAYQEIVEFFDLVSIGLQILKVVLEGKIFSERVLESFKEYMSFFLIIWLSLRREPDIYKSFKGMKAALIPALKAFSAAKSEVQV